jgi:hypothetical protein
LENVPFRDALLLGVNDPTATYVIWESAEYFRFKNSAVSVYIFPECAKCLDAPVTVYVRQIKCLWGSVFDGFYILQVIQVGLDNPVLVTVAGFKDFLRLFICLGDHGNTLDQMLWFVF